MIDSFNLHATVAWDYIIGYTLSMAYRLSVQFLR